MNIEQTVAPFHESHDLDQDDQALNVTLWIDEQLERKDGNEVTQEICLDEVHRDLVVILYRCELAVVGNVLYKEAQYEIEEEYVLEEEGRIVVIPAKAYHLHVLVR